MQKGEDIGSALKVMYQRLIELKHDKPIKREPWGCLDCTHYVRNESYNQQWGMWQFYNCYCEFGIKDKYITDYGQGNCNQFNLGDNKLNCVSEKEKLKTEYSASLGYYKSKGITFDE